jgi:hypothetical protein
MSKAMMPAAKAETTTPLRVTESDRALTIDQYAAGRTWERCKTVQWCDGHFATADVTDHLGTVGRIDVNGSSVEVAVSITTPAGAPEFELRLGDWTVDARDIDNETEDMKEVASQARELMRAWRIKHFPDIV